jgi:hypothetical protein
MPSPFDPLQLLALARDLAVDETDEAKLRTAIAQAYYAVFLIARDKARIDKRDANQHARVREAIKRRNAVAAGRFESFRCLRVQAAYYLVVDDPAFEDWEFNWREANRYAEALLEFIASQAW